MMSTRWVQGSCHGIIWAHGMALVDATVSVGEAVELWRRGSDGISVGQFLESLAAVTGTSLLSLPAFALAIDSQSATNIAVRGEMSVLVESAAGAESVSGAQVTTWVERQLGRATSLQLVAGAQGIGDERPISAGVVPAGALGRVADAEFAFPELPAEPAETPFPEVSADDAGFSFPEVSADDAGFAFPEVPAERASKGPDADFEARLALAPQPAVADAETSFPEMSADDAEFSFPQVPADDAEFSFPEVPAERASKGPDADFEARLAPAPAPAVAEPAPTLLPQDDLAELLLGALQPQPPQPSPDLEVPKPAASEPPSEYDALWGPTQVVLVDEAAVNPGPAAAPAAQPVSLSEINDHDSMTIVSLDDLGDPGDQPAPSPVAPEKTVVAILCPFDHANPPHRPRCRICQAPVGGEPVRIPRPALGWLRCPDGERLELTTSVIVGRIPRADRVRGTEIPRLLPLPNGHISSNHLEIRLEGWNVLAVDLQSRNGTYLLRPNQPPMQLPDRPLLLGAGDVLDLGHGVHLSFEELP